MEKDFHDFLANFLVAIYKSGAESTLALFTGSYYKNFLLCNMFIAFSGPRGVFRD